MTLDNLFDEIAERGYAVYSINGSSNNWHVCLSMPNSKPYTNGYRFTIGNAHGTTLTEALTQALVAIERTPGSITYNSHNWRPDIKAPPLEELLSYLLR